MKAAPDGLLALINTPTNIFSFDTFGREFIAYRSYSYTDQYIKLNECLIENKQRHAIFGLESGGPWLEK